MGLRLGTAFIEHVGDLWPEGEPAATPEWIRGHVDDILAGLELMLRRDGRDVRRLPHRLQADLDRGAPVDAKLVPQSS